MSNDPAASITGIKAAFAAKVEAEKKLMEDNKSGMALGYLARAIHDMQEAGIDVELLDMRPDTSINDQNKGSSLYTASFRLGGQTSPLIIYSKDIREGKGEFHSYEFMAGGYYDSYETHKTISININGVTDRVFNYEEAPETVYNGLLNDLIRAAAKQEALHEIDGRGVFNAPSVLRSEATKRKAPMPPPPALGGGQP